MIRSLFYLIRLLGKLSRFVFRMLSGQHYRGERKTDATFFRPATRSLDPSGTALRWEMMRGAARAAYRLGAGYLLLLLLLCLLLAGVGEITSLPPYLRPGNILLAHLSLLGISLLIYVTRRGNIDHGYSLPYFVREEVSSSTGEETEEELLAIEGGEEFRRKLSLRWYVKEGTLQWEKEKVLPLAQGLSTMLNAGTMTRAKARRMITIPRNFRDKGGIEILLPPTFTGADVQVQKRVTATVKARLGIREELISSWQMEGSSPRVLFSLPNPPPSFVSFSDFLPYLESAEEYSPFLGVIGGGEALSISLKDDSPHIAISAGSGAGKSELVKILIMHFMRRGWNVIVLDWKDSHGWCRGLPGVRYCSTAETMHDMCVSIGDEIETRKENPDVPRSKVLVVTEEMNVTNDILNTYWYALRAAAEPEEKRHMPVRSPAMSALMRLNFTGRSLGFSNIFVAQKFSARTTNGNADLRESFQVMFMSRYKPQTVAMLGNGIKPFPKSPTDPGSWIGVIGQETVRFQAPLVTDREALEYATGGIRPAASPWVVLNGATRGSSAEVDHTLEDSLPHGATRGHETLPVIEAEEVLVRLCTLTDIAIDLEYLGVTRKVLAKAALAPDSGGDPTFPPVIGGSPNKGYTYNFYDVREWVKRRNASRAAEKAARG